MVDFDFDRMVVELVVGHMEVDLIVDLVVVHMVIAPFRRLV